jgi:hypothetical protein
MPSITDWIQAGCAIGTITLAIVTLIQGRQIKTLTDVVNALTKQTKVLIANHNLDFELSRKDRMPVLVLREKKIHVYLASVFQFMITNKGQDAHHVKFIVKEPSSGTAFNPEYQGGAKFDGTFRTGELLVVRITLKNEVKFKGVIEYETNDNHPMEQEIECYNYKLILKPPTSQIASALKDFAPDEEELKSY